MYFRSLFFIAALPFFCLSQNRIELPAYLADANTRIETVKDGLGYCEGPAVDSAGNLFFSEFTTNHRIWKINASGAEEVFKENSNLSNGLAFDKQNRLVITEDDKVTRIEHDNTITVLAASGSGIELGSVNDLSLAASGAMYFTNHRGGSVFYCDEAGNVSQFTGFDVPNGIEWFEEKSIVYLCESDSQKVVQFDVASDGSLLNGRNFVSVNRPDGITLDQQGNVYVANTRDHEVIVFDSLGTSLGRIIVDEQSLPNCAFGGPENKTLFMTGGSGVYKVTLKVPGRTFPQVTSVKTRNRTMSFKPQGTSGTYQLMFDRFDGYHRITVLGKNKGKGGVALFDILGRKMDFAVRK